MSTSAVMSPLELMTPMQRVLEAVKDLPPEQQQAVLEASAAAARSIVDMRQRLYMTGSILNKIGKQ